MPWSHIPQVWHFENAWKGMDAQALCILALMKIVCADSPGGFENPTPKMYI